MTMGNSWSYVPNDQYKSARELVQLLIRIVSRGGNFLLNIDPDVNGDWDINAYSRHRDIGAWICGDFPDCLLIFAWPGRLQ